MKPAIGSDHAGLELKQELLKAINARKLSVVDFGTYTGDSVDYPDFARQVARAVGNGDCANPFESGRHERRVQKIRDAENQDQQSGR
jgi:ribose 5-phosphate isomerase RpiB